MGKASGMMRRRSLHGQDPSGETRVREGGTRYTRNSRQDGQTSNACVPQPGNARRHTPMLEPNALTQACFKHTWTGVGSRSRQSAFHEGPTATSCLRFHLHPCLACLPPSIFRRDLDLRSTRTGRDEIGAMGFYGDRSPCHTCPLPRTPRWPTGGRQNLCLVFCPSG